MASRNRKDVATLFDVFCEVGAGLECGGAVILQKYPDDFSDEHTLKSITQFSFPCGLDDDEVEAVQLFSFVLTDEKSQYTFAFCRHTPRNNTCLCILRSFRYMLLFSGLPWASTFYKILNHLSTVMNNRAVKELESLLTCAYHTPIPGPGETLIIESGLGCNKLELSVPDCTRLPTLREDKFMLEFYNAVPEKQMIALYASLLKERRVIFTGRKLSQLSSCIFAAATLLFPMHWQNLFIPVLPADLTDMLMAPMPYLVGVPKKTLRSAKQLDVGEIVVIDVDERTLQASHNDVSDLPTEAVNFLRHQLRSSSDMFLSDGLARAFLRTNVFLFGGYRLGLCHSSSSITWDREKFVQSQRANLQPFLRSLIGQDGVQYLERFIEERLEALNQGRPIDDEFEREARLMESKPLKTSQLTNPEVLQQAVSSVRENANDMFGALKDKVHSIALKERFGRLTPKEIRRSSSRKSVSPWEGALMSFDTQQWNTENAQDNVRTSPKPLNAEEAEVVVADLIDLGDSPPACAPTATQSVPPSMVVTPNATPRMAPARPQHHLSLQSFDFDPFRVVPPPGDLFTQNATTADASSSAVVSRHNQKPDERGITNR
ncbi:DENN domain-containing protein 1A [Toxocara canis]|uniref:DENN domain-containing protein 1A n=1 Tax=Toxocara canis TaxID=6265 RepID=A0A0B2VD99_TOXCA|nr:DENN domain-containing protein 1A [Toxocara canis]